MVPASLATLQYVVKNHLVIWQVSVSAFPGAGGGSTWGQSVSYMHWIYCISWWVSSYFCRQCYIIGSLSPYKLICFGCLHLYIFKLATKRKLLQHSVQSESLLSLTFSQIHTFDTTDDSNWKSIINTWACVKRYFTRYFPIQTLYPLAPRI